MHALGLEFGSAAQLSNRPGSVWNCLWGNAFKRSPGIIRKSRVSYPGPGFLSSATWPSLPKKHYNGLNQTKLCLHFFYPQFIAAFPVREPLLFFFNFTHFNYGNLARSRFCLTLENSKMDISTLLPLVMSTYKFDLNLKKKQVDVINNILLGRNTFAVLPTGFGKSMCYMLPPLLLDEVIILYSFIYKLYLYIINIRLIILQI